MPDFNPTQYAVPLFVIAVLIEMIWAKLRAPEAYEPKDTLISLSFGLGSTIAGALLGGFALAVFIEAYQYRLFDFGLQWWAVWWAWPVCFVRRTPHPLDVGCPRQPPFLAALQPVDRAATKLDWRADLWFSVRGAAGAAGLSPGDDRDL